MKIMKTGENEPALLCKVATGRTIGVRHQTGTVFPFCYHVQNAYAAYLASYPIGIAE